jgi:hypothetical protein
MDNIPWYKQGTTSTSNPFSTFGTDYCQRCKMECEADMYCMHVGETFTYKKVCCRCGKVICRGMWDHVKAITQRPLPAAAFEWCLEDGKDRR